MRKHSLITALAAVVALAATAAPANAQFVFAGGGGGAKHHHAVTLGAVKKATKKFQRLGVAKKAGYAILKDTQGIACIDNPGVGAMGVHYVKGALVGDGKVTPKTPEALVYEPRHGRFRLVAVEYVVFQAAWDANHSKPPKLFGHEFMLQTAPNRFGLDAFYMLHAWIYKHNPAGKFEPWNPRVHCPAA